MRCTRCDGLTIPQATGRTPDGRFVFGWCVTCLKETGCLEIHLSEAARKHPSRVRRLHFRAEHLFLHAVDLVGREVELARTDVDDLSRKRLRRAVAVNLDRQRLRHPVILAPFGAGPGL